MVNNKRELILARARVLFWERGYGSTTMRDLARACGFEQSNIYNYFRNKEDLLYHVVLVETQNTLNAIRRLKLDRIGSPADRMRLVLRTHIKSILGPTRAAKLTDVIALRNLSAAHRKTIIGLRDGYQSLLCDLIEQGKHTGDFAKDVDTKIACYGIASMIVNTRLWYSSRGKFSAAKIADIISLLAIRALKGGLPEKG